MATEIKSQNARLTCHLHNPVLGDVPELRFRVVVVFLKCRRDFVTTATPIVIRIEAARAAEETARVAASTHIFVPY